MTAGANKLAITTLACLVLWACSGTGDAPVENRNSGPVQVKTITVKTELLSQPVKAYGTIASKQRSAIGALVEGPVERIFVKVGDRVSKGQSLFRTRQADYQRRVIEAQAAVDLTQAQAIEAERRHERVMALAPRGFVSKAQVDRADTELAVARAQRSQAQAALQTAQQALRDTVVRAPYAGVVTARLVDEGVYLNNRFSMGGQSAAIELQEIGIVAAIVNAPQKYVDEFQRNMPARVYIEGYDEPFDSRVYIINDRVDPETRMVELRLPLYNPDYRISTGLSARAEIEVPPQSAIVLPRSAVLGDSAAAYVFVLSQGVAQRRSVRTKSVDLDRVRILSGVKAGERVIGNPPATMADGDQVRSTPETGKQKRKRRNVNS